MSTTQLFAELLVIGTGVMIWLAFLTASLFRLSLEELTAQTNVYTVVPIVALAYVLGIVMDRLGYSLFHRLETRLKKQIVASDAIPVAGDKEKYILTHSEVLGEQMTYNRSRLRICRSWIVNFLLIAITSGIWGYILYPDTALYLPVISGFLSLTTLYVWSRLVVDHYRNIQTIYGYLSTQETSQTDTRTT